MRELTLGIAQITTRPEVHSLERSLEAARTLFDKGAQLVVLPELIVPGYRLDAEFQADRAESIDGPSVEAWRELAAEAGGFIAAGFCERDRGRLYNTAVLVGAAGVVLHYRKLHTFAREKSIFAPGDLGLPVARLPFGTVGLCICYDLRFVETARILALSGAELICVPTAWVPGFDQQRLDADGFAPQARGAQVQANLDQVFIACASQAGDAWNQSFLGSSTLFDPYGRVLAGPLPGDRDELVATRIDLDNVSSAQSRGGQINPAADRRSDVYELTLRQPSGGGESPGQGGVSPMQPAAPDPYDAAVQPRG